MQPQELLAMGGGETNNRRQASKEHGAIKSVDLMMEWDRERCIHTYAPTQPNLVCYFTFNTSPRRMH